MLVNRGMVGSLVICILCMNPHALLGQAKTFISGKRVFIAINDSGAEAQQFFKNNTNSIGVVKMIYGNQIYPDDPLHVNLNVLKTAIVKAFPVVNGEGIGALDWEGKAIYILNNSDKSSSDYVNVLNEFLKALHFAKSIRPNVSWGFFGIPFRRRIFKRDEVWTSSNDNIAPLLKEVDIFLPALYSSYSLGPDIVQKGYLRSGESIFTKDAKEALRLAVKYNKIVLPFIWHRFEINDGGYRDKVIPIDQFRNIVSDIVNANYSGKKVDGIIWWSEDMYYYKHKNKVVLREAQNVNQFQKHYDSLLINYSNEIKKLVYK